VFNQQHVTLVNGTIEKFYAEGIVAGGVQYPLDVVIYATGFIAAEIDLRFRIIGLSSRNLLGEWKLRGAQAYLGTTVAGFPNLAFILGPNTGLGHNSVIHMMESQMTYIMHLLAYLETNGENSFWDVRPQIQNQYNSELQHKFRGTVWSSGCRSWYMNAVGLNTTLFPRLTVHFRRLTRKFDPSAYELVRQGD
jgi:cation diffusion facilitator CzcD-associated flavoprotein CzcO